MSQLDQSFDRSINCYTHCPTLCAPPMTLNLLKGLKFCLWNCQGIIFKFTDVCFLLSPPGKECDILGLCETWLKDHLD